MMIMTNEELLQDWLASELQDALEQAVRNDKPIYYNDEGMAQLSRVVEKTIAEMDPEHFAELRRRVDELMRIWLEGGNG
jgi:hypothetical protein